MLKVIGLFFVCGFIGTLLAQIEDTASYSQPPFQNESYVPSLPILAGHKI